MHGLQSGFSSAVANFGCMSCLSESLQLHSLQVVRPFSYRAVALSSVWVSAPRSDAWGQRSDSFAAFLGKLASVQC